MTEKGSVTEALKRWRTGHTSTCHCDLCTSISRIEVMEAALEQIAGLPNHPSYPYGLSHPDYMKARNIALHALEQEETDFRDGPIVLDAAASIRLDAIMAQPPVELPEPPLDLGAFDSLEEEAPE